jgi:hypothetical protein
LEIRTIVYQHDNRDFSHLASFIGSSNPALPASISPHIALRVNGCLHQSAPDLTLARSAVWQSHAVVQYHVLERLTTNVWIGLREQRRNTGNVRCGHAGSGNRIVTTAAHQP